MEDKLRLDELLAKAKKARGYLIQAEKVYNEAKEIYQDALNYWKGLVATYEAEDMKLALTDGRTKKAPRGMSGKPKLTYAQVVALAEHFGISITEDEEEKELEDGESGPEVQTGEEG